MSHYAPPSSAMQSVLRLFSIPSLAKLGDRAADRRRRADDDRHRHAALALAGPVRPAGNEPDEPPARAKRREPSGHRPVRARHLLARPDRRAGVAADRDRRGHRVGLHRPHHRPDRRFLPAGRHDHHADHGQPDGDPLDPAGHRAGGAQRALHHLRDHGHHHPRDPARRAPRPLGRPDRARGTLCRGGRRAGLLHAQDPVPAPDAQHHGTADRAGHLYPAPPPS